MMRQFYAAKKKHPHALLFFRMGDFYELFYEDAKLAAKELGLTLTSRSKEKDVPMAGVPVRAMEGYLVRLVRAGHTVAICEQLQDPREAKGIVERDVVRVVSPGTLVEDEALEKDRPLFVLAVAADPSTGILGLAWADISTGSFRCAEETVARFPEALARIQPAEVLLPEPADDEDPLQALVAELQGQAQRECLPLTPRPSWSFDAMRGERELMEQLQVRTLEAFGVEDLPQVKAAAGGLLAYLRETQMHALSQLRDLQLHRPNQHLVLDRATRRTLEITQSLQDGGKHGTLLAILDRSKTPMGARQLREWLLEPLVDLPPILWRQEGVAELVDIGSIRYPLIEQLDGLGDLERLATRVAGGRAGGREFVALAKALGKVPGVVDILDSGQSSAMIQLKEGLDPCPEVVDRIQQTLVDDPPLGLKEGDLIRPGYSEEVDQLRALAKGGKDYLAELQQRESERTGIPNLKIGFNKVFGYYLEITHSHRDSVPDDYIRKQTLKNAERYITPELKEYEAKVLGAEERVRELEYEIFSTLRDEVATEVSRFLECAAALAQLDALLALATVAVERKFVRPELLDPTRHGEQVLEIQDGRHPVVEALLLEEPFVPNETRLQPESHLVVLTGPNMSGKSTYLRQTALIVLLAQMGSFVPAAQARISLCDRIFTRLGSGDDITRGASTFMVEMVETANILRHASSRSLLLLDEVGRGTSTFDGLAIAWAVCEYVHDLLKARCLFATHYHQLTDLALSLKRARNMNVAVREWGDEIVFLHRIEEGGTDRSYGIHVARLAGLPQGVLGRSRTILDRLEKDEQGLSRKILKDHDLGEIAEGASEAENWQQGSLFDLLSGEKGENGGVVEEIFKLNLDNTAPIEAWKILKRVKAELERGSEG